MPRSKGKRSTASSRKPKTLGKAPARTYKGSTNRSGAKRSASPPRPGGVERPLFPKPFSWERPPGSSRDTVVGGPPSRRGTDIPGVPGKPVVPMPSPWEGIHGLSRYYNKRSPTFKFIPPPTRT